MPEDLLTELRQATRSHHERVEVHLDLATRLRGPGAYGTLLRRLHAFYAPLEAALQERERLGELPLPLSPRRKVPLLEADLALLAEGVSGGSRISFPAITDTASALGCFYVLEGATLGGQIIVREILAGIPALRPVLEAGAIHFFGSYGTEVGRNWRAFCQVLNAWGETASVAERTRCISTAIATFDAFDRWVSGTPVSRPISRFTAKEGEI